MAKVEAEALPLGNLFGTRRIAESGAGRGDAIE
jgi:hypothetical protein